jgi:hypothetical protein
LDEINGEIARKSKFRFQLRAKLKNSEPRSKVQQAYMLKDWNNPYQGSIWKKLKVWLLIGIKLKNWKPITNLTKGSQIRGVKSKFSDVQLQKNKKF